MSIRSRARLRRNALTAVAQPAAVAAAVATLLLAAGGARAQSLQQAVAHATATSPTVRGAISQARSVGHEVEGAGAAMNARFGAYTQPGYGYVRGFGRNSGFDVGLVATKPVYDGERTNHEVARQRARLSAFNERIELAQADMAVKVSDAYIEALKQQRLVELTREYVAQIDALRQRVVEIVRLDRGRAHDLLQIDSRLRGSQLSLATRQGSLQEALANLGQLVGRPITQLSVPATPPPEPATFDEVDAGLDAHPSLVAARAEVEAARRNAARAQAWNKPIVSVQGRISSPEFPLGERRWFGGYQVGLVTDWNPFDGGAGAAGARAAQSLVEAADQQVATARRDLANAVAREWTQVRARHERAASLDGLVSGAQKVRAAYWEQFRIGRRSMVDLLNAENETWQAAVAVDSERLELLQARYRLLGTQALLMSWFDLEPAASIGAPQRR